LGSLFTPLHDPNGAKHLRTNGYFSDNQVSIYHCFGWDRSNYFISAPTSPRLRATQKAQAKKDPCQSKKQSKLLPYFMQVRRINALIYGKNSFTTMGKIEGSPQMLKRHSISLEDLQESYTKKKPRLRENFDHLMRHILISTPCKLN